MVITVNKGETAGANPEQGLGRARRSCGAGISYVALALIRCVCVGVWSDVLARELKNCVEKGRAIFTAIQRGSGGRQALSVTSGTSPTPVLVLPSWLPSLFPSSPGFAFKIVVRLSSREPRRPPPLLDISAPYPRNDEDGQGTEENLLVAPGG